MVSLLLLKSGAVAFDSSEVSVPMIRMEFCDCAACRLCAAHEPAEHWLCLLHFSLENFPYWFVLHSELPFLGGQAVVRAQSWRTESSQGALSTLSFTDFLGTA